MANHQARRSIRRRDPSKTQLVGPGEIVLMRDGRPRVVDATTLAEVDPVMLDGAPTWARTAAEPSNAFTDAWVAYAGWTDTTGTPITSFTVELLVPPPPSNIAGQQVSLFPGIQNSDSLLAPALVWYPAPKGPAWTIGSYYLSAGGSISFGSGLTYVSPGDELTAFINHNLRSDGSYTCGFVGVNATILPILTVEELTWCTVGLGAYLVNQCDQYPAAQRTTFQNISIQTGSSAPTLAWTATNQVTNCGQSAQVLSNANPGGAIALNYAPPPDTRSGWGWTTMVLPAGMMQSGPVGVLSAQTASGAPSWPSVFLLGTSGSSNPPVDLWVGTWDGDAWLWTNAGSPPAAVLAAEGGLGVVAVDADDGGQVPYAFVLDDDGGAWACSVQNGRWQWTNLGIPPPPPGGGAVGIASGIGALSVQGAPPAPACPYLFVLGNDGVVWQSQWDGTAWQWSSVGSPGAAVRAPVGVLTVRNTPAEQQRPYVFLLLEDGTLWQYWFDDTLWAGGSMGAPPGVSLAAAVGAIGTTDDAPLAYGPYAFLIGTDGNLYCNWWNGTIWQWNAIGPLPELDFRTGIGVAAWGIDSYLPATFMLDDRGNAWSVRWDGSPDHSGITVWVPLDPSGSFSVASAPGVTAARDQPTAGLRPYVFLSDTSGAMGCSWLAQ
ncbi:hypothetical protein [Cryptosporangium sp. NPDC051539]|uniref:hypothetical protein n=1 Tax=Cryptosporangium sp. NPDC051539 TaxID=3363962 RepID=UPI0037912691